METTIECFINGGGHEHLRDGWSDILDDTWTLGHRASLSLPPPAEQSDHTLTMEIAAIAGLSGVAVQRLLVTVNDSRIAQIVCHGPRREEFFVPAQLLEPGQPVNIELELPDACRPSDFGLNQDTRLLALQLHRIRFAPFRGPSYGAGPALDAEATAALTAIHSLGINCEMGFLQRQAGAERLALFRWTTAPLPKLIPAIEQGLEGLGAPGTLQVHVDNRGEFLVRDSVYGFQYHSFILQSQGGTLENVLRNEYNRLRYMSRALVEDLRDHQYLLSYHDGGQSSLAAIRRLVAALNRFGPNTLLWITPTPEGANPGTAHLIEPGLIQGYVSGFQLPVTRVLPISPHQPSWIRACTAAYRIWRELSIRA